MDFAIHPMPGERFAVVLKAPGRPDEFLVDAAGAPRLYVTPHDALVAGQRATGAVLGQSLIDEARAWRRRKGRG